MAYWTGSTTVLGSNGVWTGPTRLAERQDTIAGSVFADQTGTLYVEQSADGNNWDISASHAVSASAGQGFSENLYLPFWRLRFVNGSSGQGAFRVSASTHSGGDS